MREREVSYYHGTLSLSKFMIGAYNRPAPSMRRFITFNVRNYSSIVSLLCPPFQLRSELSPATVSHLRTAIMHPECASSVHNVRSK